MDSSKFMYLTTSKSICETLKKKVHGLVRTEFNIDADVLIVDITYKDFKFRKLITTFSQYVYSGGIDELVTILIGSYKQQIEHAFFREENEMQVKDHDYYYDEC